MSDTEEIDGFLNGMSEEQMAAMMARMFEKHGAVAQKVVSTSEAAKNVARKAGIVAKRAARGPSFWDKLWEDSNVLSAIASHFDCEANVTAVMGAIQSRLDKNSVSGTFDRKDEQGRVHKVRILFSDETARLESAALSKIEKIAEAANEAALSKAVTAALDAVEKLPYDEESYKAQVEDAKVARAAALAEDNEEPPAPPAATESNSVAPPPPPAG